MFGEERVTTYSGLVRVLRERITSYVTEGIERARALRRMPEVVDVYEVTGEYDIIATAKANDLHQLRSLISERLMKMQGEMAVTTFA
ncbi:MAG: Lrp/AsnC ligand binding domain-containing protein, partial [Candidatus Caldarchaeales archaeon]